MWALLSAARTGMNWLPRQTKGDPFLTMGKLEVGDGGSCPGRRELAVASKMCPGQLASATKCILGNVAGTRKALILIKLTLPGQSRN